MRALGEADFELHKRLGAHGARSAHERLRLDASLQAIAVVKKAVFGRPSLHAPNLRLACVLVWCGLGASCDHLNQSNEHDGLRRFAGSIQEAIANGDPRDLHLLPCHPTPCISNEIEDYLLGDPANISPIRVLLSDSSVRVKIYHSVLDDTKSGNQDVGTIIYYRPSKVEFNKDGELSENEREKNWGVNYIETQVQRTDGVWGFRRTPFFYGAHLPFLDDYGALHLTPERRG